MTIKKYKIVYDRPDCIGAGACAAIFPDRWVMNKKDDLADLIGGTKLMNPNEQWILEIEENELSVMLESAQVCPVNVIHIFEVETGKKLI